MLLTVKLLSPQTMPMLGWNTLTNESAGFLLTLHHLILKCRKLPNQCKQQRRHRQPLLPFSLLHRHKNTKPVKTEVKAKISTPAIIVIIILLIIALAILRIILIRYYRKYSFTHKDYKSRVICIYRYLNKLSVHAKVRIPKKIENICTKAKFSTHNISDKEYKIVLNYVLTFRK